VPTRRYLLFGSPINSKQDFCLADLRDQLLLRSGIEFRGMACPNVPPYLFEFPVIKKVVRKCELQHQIIIGSRACATILTIAERAPFDRAAFEAYRFCHVASEGWEKGGPDEKPSYGEFVSIIRRPPPCLSRSVFQFDPSTPLRRTAGSRLR
jgi:hypothetical protein